MWYVIEAAQPQNEPDEQPKGLFKRFVRQAFSKARCFLSAKSRISDDSPLKQYIFLCSFITHSILTITPSIAQNTNHSAPLYTFVRSLQYVQDSVVSGDLSAIDMQRFLLEQVDRKLREARPEDFDEPKNVDAALIYAMSGGNPKTLDLVIARDKFGYFDEKLTGIIRAYLNGLTPSSDEPIEAIVERYLNTSIGPYIALIGANVKASAKDIKAIHLFNLARLASPGSLIEEAALRRSILVSIDGGLFDQALNFAHIYTRRFNRSPYNIQVFEFIAEIVIQNLDDIDEIFLDEIISRLPKKQQQDIYLKIAHAGLINGNKKMALKAKQKADLFKGIPSGYYEMVSNLYSDIINLPRGKTKDLQRKITAIKRRSLAPGDRPLHDAALLIAEQILQSPDEKSLTQDIPDRVQKQAMTAELQSIDLKELAQKDKTVREEVGLIEDEEFIEYMQDKATMIDDVDALLNVKPKG